MNPPIALLACTPAYPPLSSPFSKYSPIPPKTDCHLNEKPFITAGPESKSTSVETTIPKALTVYKMSFKSPPSFPHIIAQ